MQLVPRAFPHVPSRLQATEMVDKEDEIFNKGQDGVAACKVAVSSKEKPPSFPPRDNNENMIAHQCQGVCLRCQKDIDKQGNLCSDGVRMGVVPKFSYLN